MNYAPIHEPKPWEEPEYKNINSDDDSDTDVENEEGDDDDSIIEKSFSDIETASLDESDISEQDVIITNLFKKRDKKTHLHIFKTVLQEEEFFPE